MDFFEDESIENKIWKTVGEKQNAYVVVFGTEEGKKVLSDLIWWAGFENDPFDPENDRKTSYTLGMHRIVKRILSFTQMTPDELKEIAKIHSQRSQYDPFDS